MPSLTAIIMAVKKPSFSLPLSALALFGVCMAHLSLNLFDDYFDYKKDKSDSRDNLARAGIRARTGKCTYLVSGEASEKQLLTAALLFGIASAVPAVIICIHRGLLILWIVLATIFLGIFYSAGPIRLSYRGLGELTIGLVFGPLLVTGSFVSAGGDFSWFAVLIGTALGLLVTNILYVHSVLDYEADRSVGKSTLAGLIPTPGGRLAGVFVFTFLPYLLIVAGIAGGLMSGWYLLLLLTLPMGIALFRSMAAFTINPGGAPEQRKPWHGPMQKWEAIQKAQLEWFMFRWYLARNLLTAFSLICMLSALLSGR